MTAPESFCCPISLEIMKNPFMDPEGNTYELSAIELWLTTNTTSPITRKPLTRASLIPNRALREAIDAYHLSRSAPGPAGQPVTSVVAPVHAPSVQIKLDGQVDGDELLVLTSVVTKEGVQMPCDIVCVIDTSGSMSSEATFNDAAGNKVMTLMLFCSVSESLTKQRPAPYSPGIEWSIRAGRR